MTRQEIEKLCCSLASEQGSEAIQARIYELRNLALSALSQEAVRDEALEEAAMAIPSSQPRCEELRTAIRALKK